MPAKERLTERAAYGGPGWQPRTAALKDELGSVWARCGQCVEWSPLRAVLVHRPGAELGAVDDPDAVQMLATPDVAAAAAEHDRMVAAYQQAGVNVHRLAPEDPPPPNQMFMADLFFATPEGMILARPASRVRAGEERRAAERLAALGMPILSSIGGRGTFEGADAMWLDSRTVVLGRGARTNDEGLAQVTALLERMGGGVLAVDLPWGSMHLMGLLRIVDRDLALAWPGRLPHAVVEALRVRGYRVAFLPDRGEMQHGYALNVVTLGPRRILMPAGNPVTQRFYEDLGIACGTVSIGELGKAAGAVGCLTGVLRRDAPDA